jgi:hypothetical protein
MEQCEPISHSAFISVDTQYKNSIEISQTRYTNPSHITLNFHFVQRICTKENLASWLWTTVFLFFVVPNLHSDISHTVFPYTNYPHSHS